MPLTPDQKKVLARFVADAPRQTTHYSMVRTPVGNVRLDTVALGKDPISNLDAVLVNFISKTSSVPPGHKASSRDLPEVLQELKKQSVYFKPLSTPASSAQDKRSRRLADRLRRVGYQRLTERAWNQLPERFKQSRIGLFEMLLGNKAGKIGTNLFRMSPALLIPLLLGLLSQRGSNASDT